MANHQHEGMHGVEETGTGNYKLNFTYEKDRKGAARRLVDRGPFWLRSGHVTSPLYSAKNFDESSKTSIGQLAVDPRKCVHHFERIEIWEIFSGRKDDHQFTLCSRETSGIAGVTWRKDLKIFIVNFPNQESATAALNIFKKLQSSAWRTEYRPEVDFVIDPFKEGLTHRQSTSLRLEYGIWVGSSDSFPVKTEDQVLERFKKYLSKDEQAPMVVICGGLFCDSRPYAFVNFKRFKSARCAIQSESIPINHAKCTSIGMAVVEYLEEMEEACMGSDGIRVDSKFYEAIVQRLPKLDEILSDSRVQMNFESFLRIFAAHELDLIQLTEDGPNVRVKLLRDNVPTVSYSGMFVCYKVLNSPTWHILDSKHPTLASVVVLKLGESETFTFKTNTEFRLEFFEDDGTHFYSKPSTQENEHLVRFEPVECDYGHFKLMIRVFQNIPAARQNIMVQMNFVVVVSNDASSRNVWSERSNLRLEKVHPMEERLRYPVEYIPHSWAFDLEKEKQLMKAGGVQLYEKPNDFEFKGGFGFDKYKNKLHNLLFLEESECKLHIDEFNQTSSGADFFFQRNNHRLFVECDEWEMKIDDPSKLAERRPSLSVGDKLRAYAVEFDDMFIQRMKIDARKFDGVEFVGPIVKILPDSILIQMSKKFSDMYRGSKLYNQNAKWSVRFQTQENDRLRFRKYHHAIDTVLGSKVYPSAHVVGVGGKCVDRPTNILTTYSYFSPGFHPSKQQKIAISTIVMLETNVPFHQAYQNIPFLLFGPFGTGKTATLIETILQILCKENSDARIFMCTETNSSADLYIERLHAILEGLHLKSFGQNQIFRLLGPPRKRDQCFHGTSDKELFLHQYCAEQDGMFLIPSRSVLEKKKLVVGTWEASALLQYHGMREDKTYHGFFTHIFVDEAAQMIEPAAYVPVCMAMESTVVVFAGDSLQIGPKILSKAARQGGLDQSIMDCIVDSALSVQLNENFRNHEEIAKLCSQLFYKNKIYSRIDSHIDLENFPKPVAFVGVEGRDEQDRLSPSFFNMAEAEEIVEICRNILRYSHGEITESDIQIIPAFKKQIEVIRKKLKYHLPSLEMIDVGPVDSIQGREKKVVLISSVRTSYKWLQRDWDLDEGFVFNCRRLNSAMSRASCLLVFVGDPKLLADDSRKFISALPYEEFPTLKDNASVDLHLQSVVWQQIVTFCKDHGSVSGVLAPIRKQAPVPIPQIDHDVSNLQHHLFKLPTQITVKHVRMQYFCVGQLHQWYGSQREYVIKFFACSQCAGTEPTDFENDCQCESLKHVQWFVLRFSKEDKSSLSFFKHFTKGEEVLFIPEPRMDYGFTGRALFVHKYDFTAKERYQNFQLRSFDTWRNNSKKYEDFDTVGTISSDDFWTFPRDPRLDAKSCSVYLNADWLRAAQEGDTHFGLGKKFYFSFLGCVFGSKPYPFLLAIHLKSSQHRTGTRISLCVLPQLNKHKELEPLLLLQNFKHFKNQHVYLCTIFSVLQTDLFFPIWQVVNDALRSRQDNTGLKRKKIMHANFSKLTTWNSGDTHLTFDLNIGSHSNFGDDVTGQILAIICENQTDVALFWVRITKIGQVAKRSAEFKSVDVVLVVNCRNVGLRRADAKEIELFTHKISNGWKTSFSSCFTSFCESHIHSMSRISCLAARLDQEDSPVLKEILKETRSKPVRSFHCEADSSLQSEFNKDQIEAVKYALDDLHDDVYRLIIGPPGTGKTQVGSLLMILLSQGSRILNRSFRAGLNRMAENEYSSRFDCRDEPSRLTRISESSDNESDQMDATKDSMPWFRKATAPILILATNNHVVDQLLTSITPFSSRLGESWMACLEKMEAGILRIGAGTKMSTQYQVFKDPEEDEENPEEVEENPEVDQDGRNPSNVTSRRTAYDVKKMLSENLPRNQEQQNYLEEFRDKLLNTDEELKFRKMEQRAKAIQRLRVASVIGATITGAAKYHDLISDLGIEYVLVDEAAMILEADLVAALPHSTRRVILLGDHKQCSPSLDLAVWKNHRDLNLNPKNMGVKMSIFERLLGLDHSHVKLTVQYRMPSVLANNIRRDRDTENQWPLYSNSEYTDYNGDESKGDVTVGVRRQRFAEIWSVYEQIDVDKCFLKFFDHNFSSDKDSASKTATLATVEEVSEKINVSEARMVVNMAEWLLRKGVNPWSITILVMYRAQGDLIRQLLKEKAKTKNQKDRQIGYSDTITNYLCDDSLRIFSVDAFQGGENDIVLLSISRSTSNCWVNDYRRINVALSRSKVALLVFGNFSLLAQPTSEKISWWARIVSHASNYMSSSVTVKCPHHHTLFAPRTSRFDFTRAKLDKDGLWSVDEFMKESYNGGCSEMIQYNPKTKAEIMLCDDDDFDTENVNEMIFNDEDDWSSNSSSKEQQSSIFEDSRQMSMSSVENIFCRCSHEHEVPCHPLKFSTLQCQKQCTRLHVECGHFCTRPCSSPCGVCLYPVPTYLSCGHLQNVPCYLVPEIHCCSALVAAFRSSTVEFNLFPPALYSSTQEECANCGLSFVGSCFDHTMVSRCLKFDIKTNLKLPFLVTRFLHTMENEGNLDIPDILQPIFRPPLDQDEMLQMVCLKISISNFSPIDLFHRLIEIGSKNIDRHVFSLPVEMAFDSEETYLEILVPMDYDWRKFLNAGFCDESDPKSEDILLCKKSRWRQRCENLKCPQTQSFKECLDNGYAEIYMYWPYKNKKSISTGKNSMDGGYEWNPIANVRLKHADGLLRYVDVNVPEPNVIFQPFDAEHSNAAIGYDGENMIRVHYDILFIKSNFFMHFLALYTTPMDPQPANRAQKVLQQVKIRTNVTERTLKLLMLYIYSNPQDRTFDNVLRSSSHSTSILLQLLDLSFCVGMLHLHDLCDSVLAERGSIDLSIMDHLMHDVDLNLNSKWARKVNVSDMCSRFFPDKAVRFTDEAFAKMFTCMDFSFFAPKIRALDFWRAQTHWEHLRSKEKTQLICYHDVRTSGENEHKVDISSIQPKQVLLDLSPGQANDEDQIPGFITNIVNCLKQCKIDVTYETQHNRNYLWPKVKKIGIFFQEDGKKMIELDCECHVRVDRYAIGLRWKQVRSERLNSACQIMNTGLAYVLSMGIRKLSREEFEKFELSGLSKESYIKVEERYFQPYKDDKTYQFLQLMVNQMQAETIASYCQDAHEKTMVVAQFGILEKCEWKCPKCHGGWRNKMCFASRDHCFRKGCDGQRPPESEHTLIKWLPASGAQKSIKMKTERRRIIQILPRHFASGQSTTFRVEASIQQGETFQDIVLCSKKDGSREVSLGNDIVHRIQVRPLNIISGKNVTRVCMWNTNKEKVQFFLTSTEDDLEKKNLIQISVGDRVWDKEVQNVILSLPVGSVEVVDPDSKMPPRLFRFQREDLQVNSPALIGLLKQVKCQINVVQDPLMLNFFEFDLPKGFDGDWIVNFPGSVSKSNVLHRTFESVITPKITDVFANYASMKISAIDLRAEIQILPETGSWVTIVGTGFVQKKQNGVMKLLRSECSNHYSKECMTFDDGAFTVPLQLISGEHEICIRIPSQFEIYALKTQRVAKLDSEESRIGIQLCVDVCGLRSNVLNLDLVYPDLASKIELQDLPFMAIENRRSLPDIRLLSDVMMDIAVYLQRMYPHFMIVDERVGDLKKWAENHDSESGSNDSFNEKSQLAVQSGVFVVFALTPDSIRTRGTSDAQNMIVISGSGLICQLLKLGSLSSSKNIIRQTTIGWGRQSVHALSKAKSILQELQMMVRWGEMEEVLSFTAFCQRICEDEDCSSSVESASVQSTSNMNASFDLRSESQQSEINIFLAKGDKQKKNHSGSELSQALRSKYERQEVLSGNSRKVKQGHFGIIYLATDRMSGHSVVIKQIKDQNRKRNYDENQHVEESCKREYDILRMFDSRYIVKPIELFMDCSCIIMENLGTKNLADYIKECHTSETRTSEALHILNDILSGLDRMHSKGWVHQDLNPNNIMIKMSGKSVEKAVIVDVGLACSKSDQMYLGAGTLTYLSPEQAHRAELTGKSDIYSFGLIALKLYKGILYSDWFEHDGSELCRNYARYMYTYAIIQKIHHVTLKKRPNFLEIFKSETEVLLNDWGSRFHETTVESAKVNLRERLHIWKEQDQDQQCDNMEEKLRVEIHRWSDPGPLEPLYAARKKKYEDVLYQKLKKCLVAEDQANDSAKARLNGPEKVLVAFSEEVIQEIQNCFHLVSESRPSALSLRKNLQNTKASECSEMESFECSNTVRHTTDSNCNDSERDPSNSPALQISDDQVASTNDYSDDSLVNSSQFFSA